MEAGLLDIDKQQVGGKNKKKKNNIVDEDAENDESPAKKKRKKGAEKKGQVQQEESDSANKDLKASMKLDHMRVLIFGQDLLDSIETKCVEIKDEAAEEFAFERLTQIAAGNMNFFKATMQEFAEQHDGNIDDVDEFVGMG